LYFYSFFFVAFIKVVYFYRDPKICNKVIFLQVSVRGFYSCDAGSWGILVYMDM